MKIIRIFFFQDEEEFSDSSYRDMYLTLGINQCNKVTHCVVRIDFSSTWFFFYIYDINTLYVNLQHHIYLHSRIKRGSAIMKICNKH